MFFLSGFQDFTHIGEHGIFALVGIHLKRETNCLLTNRKKTGTDFESFSRLKFSCLNTLNSVTYSFYKIWVSLDDGLCSLVVVVNPLADGVLPVVKVAATLQPNPHQFVLHVKHNYLHRAAHSLLKQLCLDIRVQSASLKDWLLNLFNSCRKSINKEPCALLRHGLSQEVNHHLLKWCEDEIFI